MLLHFQETTFGFITSREGHEKGKCNDSASRGKGRLSCVRIAIMNKYVSFTTLLSARGSGAARATTALQNRTQNSFFYANSVLNLALFIFLFYLRNPHFLGALSG